MLLCFFLSCLQPFVIISDLVQVNFSFLCHWTVILPEFPGKYLWLLCTHIFVTTILKSYSSTFCGITFLFHETQDIMLFFAGENCSIIWFNSLRQVSIKLKLTCYEIRWYSGDLKLCKPFPNFCHQKFRSVSHSNSFAWWKSVFCSKFLLN